MALHQRLDMRQGQSLVMTPQLQQAIKLLQMSNMELQAFVDTELERNPLLERDERGEVQKQVAEAPTAEPDMVSALNSGAATDERLRTLDAKQARLVERRFFGGLTLEETAESLGVSLKTVHRDWLLARAWLRKEIAGSGGFAMDEGDRRSNE